MRHKVVSVFGGSTPREGSPAYDEARRLGGLLAEAGLAVATGGYGGVMEAASRGAAEAGGHVIGVLTSLFDDFQPGPNAFLKQQYKYETLRERLIHLVEQCDAAVAMPGGIGTLSEVALTWSLMQINEISVKPFVLVGPNWRETLAGFYQRADGYIQGPHWRLIEFAPDVESAAQIVALALQKTSQA